MVLELEAQKLINISLNKIASYRTQRGSSNLHKNVLVANVLRRVRNTVIDEVPSYNVSDETKVEDNSVLSDNEESIVSDEACVRPNDVFNCTVTQTSGVSQSRDSSIDVDKLSGSYEMHTDLPTNDLNISNLNDDEITDEGKSPVKARCLKRRQSDIDDSNECIKVKRRKESVNTSDDLMHWRVRRSSITDCDSDSDNEPCVELSSESDSCAYKDTSDSPMDVEQICGLVSVFRSSFQGLGFLGNGQMEQRKNVKARSYPTTNIDGLQNRSLQRGLSLPDLCAKQAVDSLSSRQSFKMCAPILALTV